MESTDFHSLHAMLEWQVDLGATEAISDTPVNRYEVPKTAPKPAAAAAPLAIAPVAKVEIDTVAEAAMAANAATDLTQLQAALSDFDHCELKRGARNLVFADGHAGARVMIIGEAPGRDEDQQGKPFVGAAGQLLDKMFAAIDLDRGAQTQDSGLYITNVLPWRPPQNRDPKPAEIAMMLPFVERHVQLAKPDLLICMGNIACQALLGKTGITRLRGTWVEAMGKPVMPMFHPAYLLRNPAAKREAWADLLDIKAKLRGT
ncbi:uracil-DNA glycosylase [Algirhabdus cladophorae]|uniref:uracil-DNA glycosylase n=1 Tax=Algirhabdus cladophorae TaxID=3377108 RepID=UPI003B8453A9